MTKFSKVSRIDAGALRNAALALLAVAALAAPVDAPAAGSTKFIPTFLIYYGGGPRLVAGDEHRLAKFDLIDTNKYRYDQIGSNTWAAVKAINPDVQIYLYVIGPETSNYMDAMSQFYTYDLGRHNVARGHFMGSLNGNHPELYLRDAQGNRVHSVAYSNVASNQYFYLMDFGSSAYQSYWLEAVKADIVDQPWVADGVFADNCLTFSGAGGYSGNPAWYPTNATWSAAMNSFSSAIATGLRTYGQKLWCNKGDTRSAEGSAAWLALDNGASPPELLLEEGAFAVKWGNGATQFFPEPGWKLQVDIMGATRNSKVAMLSHTDLSEGQTGTDNWGKPVSFGQTLWYALGSFLLGKNDVLGNAYFMFGSDYNRIWWFEEYDQLDLGKALGGYKVASIGGVNVYSREFEKGYVYVNPTASNVSSVALPQASRLLTRDTLGSLLDALPLVSTMALNGHHAAILLKTEVGVRPLPTADKTAPTVPAGFAATAMSATQINLSWSPSTDNAGVTGYYVYLNDAPLATTAATSFSHTGLVAGNTYYYRVSAYDAVPNHSAWTAAPVSVTTPVPDSTAPSVPADLKGAALSATQINLSWSAATDNAGVAGYYVYLNDAPLATTTATSFSHAGLVAGNTYNYRVSAFDAVPNHSAWTATPVSVITLVPDTTAPSVPTGLTGTAVSGTQINLSWNASTDNVGVTGYYVYLNDAPLATTTATSFSHTGLGAGNTYHYRVSAFDAVPNHSAWSAAPVPMKIAVPDTTPPAVSISSHASGATVSGTITVTASASDDVKVVGVQFKYNGINMGAEDTSVPYSVAAYTTSVPNGSYTLTAVARDAAGNLATSAPIAIEVAN